MTSSLRRTGGRSGFSTTLRRSGRSRRPTRRRPGCSSRRRRCRIGGVRGPNTPLPPDEPAGDNPPEGAVIDYQLVTAAKQPVVLEILDQAGKVVRRFASDDPVEPMLQNTNVPLYW